MYWAKFEPRIPQIQIWSVTAITAARSLFYINKREWNRILDWKAGTLGDFQTVLLTDCCVRDILKFCASYRYKNVTSSATHGLLSLSCNLKFFSCWNWSWITMSILKQTNFEFRTWIILETICHAQCEAIMRFSKLDHPHPHIDVSDTLRVFILEVQTHSQCIDRCYRISEHEQARYRSIIS